jgi:hypothetical protein
MKMATLHEQYSPADGDQDQYRRCCHNSATEIIDLAQFRPNIALDSFDRQKECDHEDGSGCQRDVDVL